MKKDYKKKLDILRQHMNTSKRVAAYLEKVEERKPTELKEDINKGVSYKELKEKGLIHTVASMSSFKSSTFYQLQLVSQSMQKMEKAGIEYNPLLKKKTVGLAKKRIKELIVRLSSKND